MRLIHAWILLAFALCEAAEGKTRPPQPVLPIMIGNASWYGWRHHGLKTASGLRFHALAETGASLTYPLGTWVRVTNLGNGRNAVIQITDRGPYIRGRVLDVSLGTAIKLDMVRAGVVRVRIEPLPGKPAS